MFLTNLLKAPFNSSKIHQNISTHLKKRSWMDINDRLLVYFGFQCKQLERKFQPLKDSHATSEGFKRLHLIYRKVRM